MISKSMKLRQITTNLFGYETIGHQYCALLCPEMKCNAKTGLFVT